MAELDRNTRFINANGDIFESIFLYSDCHKNEIAIRIIK